MKAARAVRSFFVIRRATVIAPSVVQCWAALTVREATPVKRVSSRASAQTSISVWRHQLSSQKTWTLKFRRGIVRDASDDTGRHRCHELNENGFMGDFLKSWRRKAGCVLLVMVTFLWGCWVRSLKTADVIGIPGMYSPRTKSFFLIASTSRGLEWRHVWSNKGKGHFFGRPSGSWISTSIEEEAATRPYQFQVTWNKSYSGIRLEGGTWGKPHLHVGNMSICVIPYWFIVFPLTLLSAYLILWPGKQPVRQTKALVDSV